MNFFALASSQLGIESFTINLILLSAVLMVFGLPMFFVLIKNQKGPLVIERKIGL